MKLEVPSQIHDPDQNVALNELRSEIEQRFSSLDLHDRITRDPSRVIGFGNYGLVCEGSLLSEPNSRVAVKVVRYGDKGALPVLKRVLAEVYVWSKLKHEHIHELLGITTVFDHTISIISPLMSTGNAFDYVQNPKHDPRPLILGIANGLNYLHNYEHGCNSIVHGDVKGPNVLISNDGRALLTDFGFSHLAKASFSLAKEEHAGGTLDWMPPEYLDSDQFSMTVEGDVWAYGMTILELFTRRRPFHYLNHKVAILKHILMNDRKRPSDEDTNCRMTDEWWEICQSCWNRKPSLRPSMSTVIQEISRLQTTSRVTTSSFPCNQSTSTNTNVKSVPGEVVELPSVSGTNLYGRVDKDLTAHPVHGAFMVVYRGTLRPEGTKVAIKTARGGLCGNEQVTKQVRKEVHLWSKLHHDNILPLIGITTEFDQILSVVTPWMEKGNAHDYVQDKTVDPCPLIEGIAQGLRYMHTHVSGPIFHGDLKGTNVLISDNGQPLLSDFSSAVAKHSVGASMLQNVGGSIRWIAPELLDDGGELTAEGDIWAFGMTALELFTRTRPYNDVESVRGVIVSILKGPPNRPSDEQTCSRMTDMWWDICTLCWRSDASLRPTMSHIVEKIEGIMALHALRKFSELASVYHLNLNEKVEQDTESVPVRGSRGIVNWGTLGKQGTQVAVKTISCRLSHNTDVIKHLLNSLHVLSQLHHENILPLLGITIKFGSEVSFVSLWMNRGNAHDYVQDCAISPIPLLMGIASGLDYLHTQSPQAIFHGGLKGYNVLVSHNEQALLVDFGLCHLLKPPFMVTKSYTHDVNWMAPEHLDDLSGSTAGDIWGFGMTVLELFTRALPFDNMRSPTELKHLIRRGIPNRPNNSTACSRLTNGWWNICILCWKQDPLERPSIATIIREIEEEQLETMRKSGDLWKFLLRRAS